MRTSGWCLPFTNIAFRWVLTFLSSKLKLSATRILRQPSRREICWYLEKIHFNDDSLHQKNNNKQSKKQQQQKKTLNSKQLNNNNKCMIYYTVHDYAHEGTYSWPLRQKQDSIQKMEGWTTVLKSNKWKT